MKCFLGIDPGKTGFITELTVCDNGKTEFEFHPIPLIGTEVDVIQLADIFYSLTFSDHCVIEDVHAIFGSSAKSTFEFGRILGMLEAFLASNKIPVTKVQPKIWQKEMWQGIPLQTMPSKTGKTSKTDTKKMSLLAVKRLYPSIDLRRTSRAKVNDHNKIDSILMAEYCRRKF